MHSKYFHFSSKWYVVDVSLSLSNMELFLRVKGNSEVPSRLLCAVYFLNIGSSPAFCCSSKIERTFYGESRMYFSTTIKALSSWFAAVHRGGWGFFVRSILIAALIVYEKIYIVNTGIDYEPSSYKKMLTFFSSESWCAWINQGTRFTLKNIMLRLFNFMYAPIQLISFFKKTPSMFGKVQ